MGKTKDPKTSKKMVISESEEESDQERRSDSGSDTESDSESESDSSRSLSPVRRGKEFIIDGNSTFILI